VETGRIPSGDSDPTAVDYVLEELARADRRE
jgi:hypothetical protein